MLAKRFFYVSAGLFLLALTYHLGARSATAQAGSSIVGALDYGNRLVIVTSNGDVFANAANSAIPDGMMNTYYVGNFWGSVPTTVTPTTLGRVKAEYRR